MKHFIGGFALAAATIYFIAGREGTAPKGWQIAVSFWLGLAAWGLLP